MSNENGEAEPFQMYPKSAVAIVNLAALVFSVVDAVIRMGDIISFVIDVVKDIQKFGLGTKTFGPAGNSGERGWWRGKK